MCGFVILVVILDFSFATSAKPAMNVPRAFFSFVVLLSQKIYFLVSLLSQVRHRLFLRFSFILASHVCNLLMDNINRRGVDDFFSGLGLLVP